MWPATLAMYIQDFVALVVSPAMWPNYAREVESVITEGISPLENKSKLSA